jgi:bacteriocin biosynthesis cyclodehydratase domain-containing protein
MTESLSAGDGPALPADAWPKTVAPDAVLVVAEGLDIVPISVNEVLVRFGSRSMPSELLRDADLKGLLSGIMLRLDQHPVSVRDLLRSLTPAQAADVAHLIDDLFSRGILTTVEASPVEQYLRYTFTGHSELREQTAAVIGAGPVGTRIAHSLLQHGVGCVKLLDSRVVDANWNGFRPFGVGAAPEGQRADAALAEILRGLPGPPSVEVGSVEVGGDEMDPPTIGALLAGADLGVVALESHDPRLLHTVNRAAIKSGKPWLLASIDGNLGLIGPLFLPGRTACFNCYAALSEAATPNREVARKYRQHLLDGGHRTFFPALPAYADIVAGHATLAGVQFLLGRSSFVLGRVAIFDFLRMIVDTEDVLRLPRCPVCSLDHRPARPAFGAAVASSVQAAQ